MLRITVKAQEMSRCMGCGKVYHDARACSTQRPLINSGWRCTLPSTSSHHRPAHPAAAD